jgi:hypothetical protein
MKSDVVNLNVGGQLFSTTMSTLSVKGDNFFTSLLSGRVGVVKEAGVIFIDRSPDLFAPILDFLRTGRVTLRGMDENSVRAEAAFYGVEMPKTTPKSKDISLIAFSVYIYHHGGSVSTSHECAVYGVLAGDKDGQFCISSWVKVRELVSVAEKEGWKVERTSTEGGGGVQVRHFIWELSRDIE